MSGRKNSILFFLFFLLVSTTSFSQTIKKKARKNVRAADLEMYNNNFQTALKLYRKAYEMDSTNMQVAYKLGTCLYSIRKYKQESLRYFEKARGTGISDIHYYLGSLYHLHGRFNDAIREFQEYKNITTKKTYPNEEIDLLINKCKTAIELVKKPVNVSVENMGRTINSEYPDYVPVISADESMLIFTSRREGSTGNLLDPFGDYFEDVYISTKKDSVWSDPRNLSTYINTPTHDACVGLSADGELLFLYRTSEDLLSGDLYLSIYNGWEWMSPKKLPPPINTEQYTEPSASLSADGEILYFSSNRPGGYGKKDIYKIAKLPNGEWSKEMNLGPLVNTSEDEDSPFIHPDRKTLYFSSKGHKNMGGYDIFKTSFDNDAWSMPENLGYPVNTPDDDIYFVLSTDGKRGYYSSVRDSGFGGSDLYMIRFLDEDLRLTVYKSVVISTDSSDVPLSAKITLFNNGTKILHGIYNTNPLTGKFIMIVTQGKEYDMHVESRGYDPYDCKVNQLFLNDVNKIKLQKTKK